MFLEYLALGLLLVCLIMVFYAVLYVHELPYEAAVHRKHPQQEAIYVACWLSLFTLHAIWPIVWIWAVSYGDGDKIPGSPHGGQPAQGGPPAATALPSTAQADALARLARLEAQVAALQGGAQTTVTAAKEG